uniref:Protein kinase domain-containing protein n=1 Tax=Leersia perrieri TaxID=77586 RepID=A0A0D9WT79_9ORYZ
MGCFSLFFKRSSTVQRQSDASNEDFSGAENITRYSYKELAKATQNFDQSNKIGEGGFGPVYKGTLKDGTDVAVKLLSIRSRQGVKEFLNELIAISDISHDNLVKLHGCCVEGGHRILVYNYLENNDLQHTLLGSRQSNIQFNWRTRVNICIGVARGLAFLHDGVRPHIVHRDIKASNILLDKDLTPKISDFGLAKLLPLDASHVSTRVAGTLCFTFRGYLAPEYAIRGQVTRKSDVYSFGVLLVEIVSGRCNTDTKLPYEDQILLEKTWRYYDQGHLEKIIDSSIGDDVDVDEACRFLKVGLLCTQDITKRRPTMSTVMSMLTGEMEVDNEKISKPDVIRDFRDLKLRSKATSSSSLLTSIMAHSTPSSSQETTRTSITFTAISDRN